MDEIFDQLKEWSQREDSFSIRDYAEEIGVPYKKILELSKENEDWGLKLEMARGSIACRAELTKYFRDKSDNERSRCMYENDLFFRAWLEEEEGIEIPDDPDEFDVWVEERIAKDNAELVALNKPKTKRGDH